MVKVSADSTCDLSYEILNRFNIAIVPLYIIKDGESYKDGLQMKSSDIFEYVDKHGKLLKTAAASVTDYIEFFKKQTEDGSSVVHVTISSEMSCSFQNAAVAAKEFENVHVIDSRNLSTGMGHIVYEGALMAEKGMSATEIEAALNELTSKVEASFVVDRLDYLYKGGRCSAVAALGANMLSLKPCIEVKDGKMGVAKKYRGSFDKALRAYVKDRLEGRDDIVWDRCFITHPACKHETVELVRQCVNEFGHFDEVIETRAGCTISNHCGPYTLGILFIRK
ncbi:MAG: DegV family protein [Clostridiales bacterium]|nr:DegV family protein [Clostridiales bacterium]